MANIFNMPKLGMDMEEGTITTWFKKNGEEIRVGEAIAEIETDKATVTVESPYDGVILDVYCNEGDTVPINTAIAVIGEPGEIVQATPQEKSSPLSVASAYPRVNETIADTESGSMMVMPKLGMDMNEGTLIRWLIPVGDSVTKGAAIADIETDKATLALEATRDGILLKTYCTEGDIIPVGQPIAFIGDENTSVPDLHKHSSFTEQEVVSEATPARAAFENNSSERNICNTKKIRISPRAKKLAEKNNVNLNLVVPSGAGGRIVEKDIRRVMQNNTESMSSKVVGFRSESIKAVSGLRKVISHRMRRSLSEMAQANHRMDADMTNICSLRKQLNESFVFAENKVSLLDLIALACARALRDFPYANSAMMPDGIHYKEYVNVGIAVDTERGLVVPVIHNADLLSLKEFSAKSKHLISKAQQGRLMPDEMQGGTFTISNLGMYGVTSFTAINNPPEACILALGCMEEKAVVINGSIVIRPIMTLSLTYDHRIIDGAPAARFLQRIRHYIENPAQLLL